MKLLCIQPGASYATGDVASGYVRAIRALGHEAIVYALDARIDLANEFYHWVYRREGHGPVPQSLVLQHAAAHIVPQALYHEVDGVLVFSGMSLHPDVFILLKRAGIPTALVLSESPYDDMYQARVLARRDRGVPVVDIAFTNERASLPRLRHCLPETHYLGHAYHPEVSRPDGARDTPCDVLFLGTLFEERMELLAGVDWDGIDLALYGQLKLLPSRHRLRRYIRGEIVANDDAQSLYRAAKIVLNPYRTSRGFGRGVAHIDHAESLNPRSLELAACGVFHTSEYREEVGEVFGDLVPTYSDSESLEWLIRYYLSAQGEGARREMAQALPGAVTGHTYAARAAELMERIAASWSSRRGNALSA
jgi:spore maturation protein CgeB